MRSSWREMPRPRNCSTDVPSSPSGPEALSPEKLLTRAKHAPIGLGILHVAVKLYPGALHLWRALAAREQEAGNTPAAEAALARMKAQRAPSPAASRGPGLSIP